MGIPGDDLRGVVPATLFLKQVNLGEAPRLSGPVVVVGGGSTAMDAARSAVRSGAERVTVVYRRGRADMPAQTEEIEAAEREGIAILDAVAPAAVLGDGGSVTALRGIRQRRAERPDGDRAMYEPVTDGSLDIPASTILVAIGEEPDPSILPEGAGIEISGWAGIVADPRTFATGRPGVFAGGDVVSGPKTIIDAVAAGRRAAGSIHEYLAGVADGEAEILRAVRYRTEREESLELDLAVRARAHAALPVVELGTFRAGQIGFGAETARAEAARCFRCDAIAGAPTVRVTAGRGPADRAINDSAPAGASIQGGGR